MSLRAPLLTVILREQSDRRISPLRAGSGVAILVPSESEESRFEIASSLTLLAMTEKGTPRNDKEDRAPRNDKEDLAPAMTRKEIGYH